MGPRIFIRGYVGCLANRDLFLRLQWGRGFSSADTRAPEGSPAEDVGLQWGRGFSSADTVFGDHLYVVPLASMGPRIFIRGYKNTRISRSSARALQWGRGFSSADTCGRRPQPTVATRFNGAADFHPRIRRAAIGAPRGYGASMGPRIFIRGYESGPFAAGSRACFNGAADFHPRILRRSARSPRMRHPSMGPRIFIRGYLPAIGPPMGPTRLQWGRGFSSADT